MMLRFLFILIFSSSVLAMQKEDCAPHKPSSSESDVTRVLLSICENHPVKNPNIRHYSLYRAFSVSTYIEDRTFRTSSGSNYYLSRTISQFPKEGIKETYGGTQEKSTYKRAMIVTPEGSYEPDDQILGTQIEGLTPSQAQTLFTKYILDYNLTDKSRQDWLKEIQEKNKNKAAPIKSDNTL